MELEQIIDGNIRTANQLVREIDRKLLPEKKANINPLLSIQQQTYSYNAPTLAGMLHKTNLSSKYYDKGYEFGRRHPNLIDAIMFTIIMAVGLPSIYLVHSYQKGDYETKAQVTQQQAVYQQPIPEVQAEPNNIESDLQKDAERIKSAKEEGQTPVLTEMPNMPPEFVESNVVKYGAVIIEGESLQFTAIFSDPNDLMRHYYKIDDGAWTLSTKAIDSVSGLSIGNHTLYLKAIDSKGLESKIQSATVQVKQNQRPALTASLNKERVDVGEQVFLTTDARDPDGHDVTVYMQSPEGKWNRINHGRQLVTNMPVGNYAVAVKAVDEFGLESEIIRKSFEVWQKKDSEYIKQPPIQKVPESSGPYAVLSPNGGEVWQLGTTQTIRWKINERVDSSIKIQMMKGIPGDWNRSRRITTYHTSEDATSYDWFIDPSMYGQDSDYWVNVARTSGTGEDWSDGNFALTRERAESIEQKVTTEPLSKSEYPKPYQRVSSSESSESYHSREVGKKIKRGVRNFFKSVFP